MRRKTKLYKYIPQEVQRLLSLNYLLSDKIFVDWRSRPISTIEQKEWSKEHNNKDYNCMTFYKHISRNLSKIQDIDIEKL